MRIVHIGTSDVPVLHRFGGALQRRILELARLQAAAGNDVAVMSPGADAGVREVDGVRIVSLPLRSRRPVRDYEMLVRARRWLRRSVDVVHAHGAPAAATMLRDRGAATVHSVDFFRYRGSSTSMGRRFYTARLDAFDLNLPASRYCASEFTRYYPRLSTPVRVLYNGVSRQQFRRDPNAMSLARRELGLPDGPLVVYLGRICEQKGSDLLAPLAAALRERVPAATVVAAGPPEQFARTASTGLGERLRRAGVHCPGAVDETLVAGLLSGASVFVLPTRRDEMFGMAALEGISCGAPVVAADLGGIPEAVGPCGLLFPAGDADAFADAVTRVLTDDALADALRRHGPEHAERFEWSSVVDECMTHYAEALEWANLSVS